MAADGSVIIDTRMDTTGVQNGVSAIKQSFNGLGSVVKKIGVLIGGLADKICGLRVFADEAGKMNLNLAAVGGALLVVSQFTLYADIKSRRPGFTKAAPPAVAIPLYETFLDLCRARGFQVEHGAFGADMAVQSVNDGPVTIWMDTETL